jgi:hypothetical protein
MKKCAEGEERPKIVSIFGGKNYIPHPRGKPVKTVVDLVEKYMAMAQSGELRAVALAAVIDDGTDMTLLECEVAGATYTRRDMTCSLERLVRAFDREGDDCDSR